MRVLREAALLNSIEAGLLRHFPGRCADLGRTRLWQFVNDSRDHARGFGFEAAECQGFASFELIFGERYWDAMEYRWARRILEDKDIEVPADRFKALREAAIFFLAKRAEKEAAAQAALDNSALEEAAVTGGHS
jgi:hypothetical protein